MTEPVKFTFNLFTIEAAVRAADPSLTAAQISAAYDALIDRGTILPDVSPPLSRAELVILDVLRRRAEALAQEHQKSA
jgi:hypothetical protein